MELTLGIMNPKIVYLKISKAMIIQLMINCLKGIELSINKTQITQWINKTWVKGIIQMINLLDLVLLKVIEA